MRICLLTLDYPPSNTEGIPRQRYVLATALARLGNEVHVVSLGPRGRERYENGVWVHELRVERLNQYSEHDLVNGVLTRSQALYEGLSLLHHRCAFDVVETPLWSAAGFVLCERFRGPTVVWLQTTTAQLLAINNQEPGPEHRQLMQLERRCLARAGGVLADSQCALAAVDRDYQIPSAVPTAIAYLGLPAPSSRPDRDQQEGRYEVEALVVGRLERRKGTPLLLDALPEMLGQNPDLRVRFVGRDNSQSDGWSVTHGSTYPEYFRSHHPDLCERVVFDGYVSEQRLAACYEQADFVLAPSLYESFGLVYLEAMRASLPVVALASGSTAEIFPAGEKDGAVLVSIDEPDQLSTAVSRLAQDRELRRELGQRGFGRFVSTFTDSIMARATLRFYEQVLTERIDAPPRAAKIYQVMEALDVGDAVSTITCRNQEILRGLGGADAVLVRFAHEAVEAGTAPYSVLLADAEQSGLIFHFWNHSASTWLLDAVGGPKAIYYHNITPPRFFPPGSPRFANAARGYAQIAAIVDVFDLIIGDSRYNIHELARYLDKPKPGLHIYPIVEPQDFRDREFDEGLAADLSRDGMTNFVFVGRVARNKRQEKLLDLFDHYFREVDRYSRLLLVGDDQCDPQYMSELEHLRARLSAREQIVFTGKVSKSELAAYYRSADVFVCASEHEGFCMPLIEAMSLGIPVVAYAAAAVPETMGSAGIVVHDWDVPRIAELIHVVLSEQDLRQHVLELQCANLGRFTEAAARERLAAVVDYLRSGVESPLFEWLTPCGQQEV